MGSCSRWRRTRWFWGELTAEGELPDGVWIGERQTFYNKKIKGYTFPVFVDVAKAPKFEATFVFTGKGKARMSPALTGYDSDVERNLTELEVTEFEVDGDKSSKLPAKFKNWLSMTPFIASEEKKLIGSNTTVSAGQKYWQFFVTGGRTIKVKAAFRVPEE